MRLCQEAIERGVFAQAIRPPTVPAGHLAAAPDGDGLAHPLRAARWRRRCSGAPPELGLDPQELLPAPPERVPPSPSRVELEASYGAGPLRRRRSTSRAARPLAEARARAPGARSPGRCFDIERDAEPPDCAASMSSSDIAAAPRACSPASALQARAP